MIARDVLVVAELHAGVPADITYELLAAARSICGAGGGQVTVLLAGDEQVQAVPSLAAADRIVLVQHAGLRDYAPESLVAVTQEIVAETPPLAVLVGSTSIGWDLAPLLAGRLNAPLVTGCQSLRLDGEELQVTAAFCAGKMLADITVNRRPAILMVLPGCWSPAKKEGEARIEVRRPAAPLDSGAVRFLEWLAPPAGDVDITQQEVLVAVGRGIQQQENLPLAEELAQTLGGAVCASRPVVDQGWLPTTRQVGKSGMTVRPKLYLALGISGAPEHQEGMKGADLIIAVNTDGKAPLFDIAHYGAEVDALELLPALNEAVSRCKA